MIRFDVEQGTTEWANLRLGIPTASEFSKIIQPKKGGLSASAGKYAARLIAEQLTGSPMDDATSGFMQRGSAMERKAIQYYEMKRDCDVERVGFIMRDDRRVGCSPDGLVGTDGLLELKTPSAPVHVQYMLGDESVAEEYRCQVQGQLWLCERDWIDTESYNPRMSTVIFRNGRDEEFIKKLSAAVDQFLSYLDECKLRLVKTGMVSRRDFPGLTDDLRIVA